MTVWQDFMGGIKNVGADLVAISSDTVENHALLHKYYGLELTLLSDPNLSISSQYGIYRSEYGSHAFGEPALVILDKDGLVAYSIVSSGSKGLPDPGTIAQTLIYMQAHSGKY
jgi:peroxiredoxin